MRILEGDCLDVLADPGNVADEYVDLIFTSPPYADRRKKQYGGIAPDEYVEWFLARSIHFERILKASGSFVVNIKENAENGERLTYVLDLIVALRRQGWLWVEEYVWRKKSSTPGKWPNRFRDGFERILHFTKASRFKMNQDAVMQPAKPSSIERNARLYGGDGARTDSPSGSGFGRKLTNFVGRDLVYPDNVVEFAPEVRKQNHPAPFPRQLPNWFIRLFTDPGDVVLDPFAGSGTTTVEAINLHREAIAIEIDPAYCEIIRSHPHQERLAL